MNIFTLFFVCSVNDLEATHEEQHFTIVREASKELKGLQKRFLMESVSSLI